MSFIYFKTNFLVFLNQFMLLFLPNCADSGTVGDFMTINKQVAIVEIVQSTTNKSVVFNP